MFNFQSSMFKMQKPAEIGGLLLYYCITASSRSPIGKCCYGDDGV